MPLLFWIIILYTLCVFPVCVSFVFPPLYVLCPQGPPYYANAACSLPALKKPWENAFVKKACEWRRIAVSRIQLKLKLSFLIKAQSTHILSWLLSNLHWREKHSESPMVTGSVPAIASVSINIHCELPKSPWARTWTFCVHPPPGWVGLCESFSCGTCVKCM